MKRFTFLLLPVFLAGTALSQSPNAALSRCDAFHLQGTYAATYLGWLAFAMPDGSSLQVSGVIMGVLSVGPTGVLTGNVTVSTQMGKAVWETMEGSTVAINADCTGTITTYSRVKGTSDPAQKEIDRFVMIRDAGELVVMIDDLGPGVIPMCLGSWKKIASWPDRAEW